MSKRVEERQNRASEIVGVVFYSILVFLLHATVGTFRPEVTAAP